MGVMALTSSFYWIDRGGESILEPGVARAGASTEVSEGAPSPDRIPRRSSGGADSSRRTPDGGGGWMDPVGLGSALGTGLRAAAAPPGSGLGRTGPPVAQHLLLHFGEHRLAVLRSEVRRVV